MIHIATNLLLRIFAYCKVTVNLRSNNHKRGVAMSISVYRKKSGQILKGNYAEAFAVVLACILVYAVFKTTDVLTALFLSFSGIFSPEDIMFSSGLSAFLIKALRFLLCFAAMTPLITGTVWWFSQTAAGEDNRSILKLYTGFRLNLRSAVLYGMMWTASFLTAVPVFLSWYGGYRLLLLSQNSGEPELFIFAAFQFFILGLLMVFFSLLNAAGMSAAPFIFIKKPGDNPLRAFFCSYRIMRGRKLRLIKLMLSYLPVMLGIVTIPFVLPKAFMALAVYVDCAAKEEGVFEKD